MDIDLRKLFQGEDGFDRNSNGVIERQYELDLSGVELGGAKPFCAPVRVRARLRGFAGSVELFARVEYTMSMPCDRCAEPVTREYTKEFSHTLVRESREDTGEFITVPDERLDLDALVLEDLLMDMPGQYLCREDCKGLCPSCGKNWNEGPCKCGAPQVDPRLEVLRQLL